MATPMLKKSRQRDAILTNLQNRCDHPTADMIYMDIRKEIPNISLGTVYRNLSLLTDHGMIIKLSVDGKADRFDACTENHYHFICQECGNVDDLPALVIPGIHEAAQKNFSGKITDHRALFFGTCECCLSKKH